MSIHRPTLRPIALSLIVAFITVFAFNNTFWQKSAEYMNTQMVALISMGVGLFAIHAAVFAFSSARYIFKPVLALFIIVGGVASWFVDQFGIVVDEDMIRNVAETTVAETNNLMTAGYLIHLVFFVFLPLIFVFWVKVDYRPPLKQAMHNLACFTGLFAVFAALGLANTSAYYATFHDHKELIKYLNPVMPIGAAIKFARDTTTERNIVMQPIGEDAKVAGGINLPGHKPRVLVLIVGETARSMNFSLNGYQRDTNPKLAQIKDLINFPNVTSCGTNTAYSVPCMFSIETRSSFSHRKAKEKQNVLDVISGTGIDVEWWDNNTGDKHVADRIKLVNLMNSSDPKYCFEGECQDGLLLEKLDGWLDNVKQDSILVLHTLGSHGPSYYKRYPEEYRAFKPDCRTAEMGKCSREEIINAYDNTLYYTDHIISEVINHLKTRTGKLAPAMIYLSDHGESLGENGVYLHSAPILFAPFEQTSVPMVWWISSDYANDRKIDIACLRNNKNKSYSQDNLFHTLLGMFDIKTAVHDRELDITASCKTGKTA